MHLVSNVTQIQDNTWLFELTASISSWLEMLYKPDHPGQLKFCLKGNIIEPSPTTGLGASALALKLAYQIGLWDQLDVSTRAAWVDHIRSFQEPEIGYFEDQAFLIPADYIAGKSWYTRNQSRIYRKLGLKTDIGDRGIKFDEIKTTDLKKKDKAVRRAESRQAAAALMAAGSVPSFPFTHIPTESEAIVRYLDRLPWYWNPWHSGSHTAYLVFALKMNAEFFEQRAQFEALLPIVFSYLDRIQDTETGAWFKGSWLPRKVPLNQQVNGAMKVLTAYRLMNMPFHRPERLIDLCLMAFDDRDACHSVDLIYVLHECAQLTSHRLAEIHEFAKILLTRIKRHLKADGALSFFPDWANTTYYGVPISRGLPESDVHGSHLLVWAATLCVSLLGYQDQLGWRMPIT